VTKDELEGGGIDDAEDPLVLAFLSSARGIGLFSGEYMTSFTFVANSGDFRKILIAKQYLQGIFLYCHFSEGNALPISSSLLFPFFTSSSRYCLMIASLHAS